MRHFIFRATPFASYVDVGPILALLRLRTQGFMAKSGACRRDNSNRLRSCFLPFRYYDGKTRDLSLCFLNTRWGIIRKTIDVGCDLRVYMKEPMELVITGLYLILISYLADCYAIGSR